MRGNLGLVIAMALALAPSGGWADDEPGTPSAEELLAKLRGADFRTADQAAEALARGKSDAFVPAALEQLKTETEFHARLSLGYALAVHGEKAGLEVLVDSLEHKGHLGFVYLQRVADVNHGWNPDGSSLANWRTWLAEFTADEYRARVRRDRLSFEVRQGGAKEFEAVVKALCEGADRAAIAGRFREIARSFPLADAAADAHELAERLDEEVKEDAAWKEPPSPASLTGEAKAAWLVFHLRDARGAHLPFDGYTSVLPRSTKGSPPASGAVAGLLEGGVASVPLLLSLLEDRRPIRARGWDTRKMSPGRWVSVPVVLRYQDAALELLNVLLPTPTYERAHSATYLSAEAPPAREALIANVRSWAAETLGKSELEIRWAGVRRAQTRNALEMIRRMAVESNETQRALTELEAMFQGGRHPIHQPAICEVMVALGDTSKVAEVIEALDAGKYGGLILVEDDSAAGFHAERIAKRLKEMYGKESVESGKAGMR